MSRIYHHRVNTLEQLRNVPSDAGLEFDLRSDGDDVIITHDPFTRGPRVDDFFPHIGARPCIFNVKCEGIEPRVLAVAKDNGIEEFFFLDCSVPAAVKLWRAGERRIAVRYSEIEPAEGVLAWADKASWCWVDCFTRYPTDEVAWNAIGAAFRICLVSPELQGHGVERIGEFRAGLAGRRYDAVCTKHPDRWAASDA